MHTDEYEISIGREIAFCRKMVRKLKDSLERREKQCGMTAEVFLKALEEGCLSEQYPIQKWNQEYQEFFTRTISVVVSEPMYQQLVDLTRENDYSLSQWIREAISLRFIKQYGITGK